MVNIKDATFNSKYGGFNTCAITFQDNSYLKEIGDYLNDNENLKILKPMIMESLGKEID